MIQIPFKNKEREKEYKRDYYEKNRERLKAKSRKYYRDNRERISKRDKKYRRKHKDEIRAYGQKIKLKAMQIVSGLEKPECINCGCDDMRVLEINHKNLGGYKEYKTSIEGKQYKNPRSARSLYHAIIRGDRKTEDLEITCKVCNAKHYVETKFGLKFKVEFNAEAEERLLSKTCFLSR